ncbi:hypothetical protein D9M68_842730 [compost metagenome]
MFSHRRKMSAAISAQAFLEPGNQMACPHALAGDDESPTRTGRGKLLEHAAQRLVRSIDDACRGRDVGFAAQGNFGIVIELHGHDSEPPSTSSGCSIKAWSSPSLRLGQRMSRGTPSNTSGLVGMVMAP